MIIVFFNIATMPDVYVILNILQVTTLRLGFNENFIGDDGAIAIGDFISGCPKRGMRTASFVFGSGEPSAPRERSGVHRVRTSSCVTAQM